MQGKDKMIDDILQSARKTAAAMIAEAEAEQKEQAEKLRASLEALAAENEAEAERAAQSAYAGEIKLGELDAAKALLKAKQECVSAVYAKVRETVLALPDAKYLDLIAKLISGVVEDGDEIVAAARDSKRVTAEWVKKLASSCKKKLSLAKEKGDFDGGVILRNQKYERDFTIDAIIEDLRERTVSETVEKLGL